MKHLLILLSLTLWFASGCVVTPTGEVITAPVEAEVELGPRIYTSSRSRVSIWLHPSYVVADAYPIAQRYCSRWGMWASPVDNWSYSASVERYLDYTCVSSRPHLAYPHIRRGSRYYPGRRYRTYPRRRVYTPKPTPRPPKRRTFGGAVNSTPLTPAPVTVERGKPWEHRAKKPVFGRSTTQPVTIERGKPWEHKKKKSVFGKSFGSSKRKSSALSTRSGSLSSSRSRASSFSRGKIHPKSSTKRRSSKRSSFGL